MTLGSDILRELPYLREQAESRMISLVNVRRITSRDAQDEETGLEGSQWATVLADLPFRLKAGSSRSAGTSRSVTIGGITFEEATAEGHMPATATDLADNDLLEVTAGEWAGTVWRIVEAIKGDQRTARRVPIVEAERPPEWDA